MEEQRNWRYSNEENGRNRRRTKKGKTFQKDEDKTQSRRCRLQSEAITSICLTGRWRSAGGFYEYLHEAPAGHHTGPVCAGTLSRCARAVPAAGRRCNYLAGQFQDQGG